MNARAIAVLLTFVVTGAACSSVDTTDAAGGRGDAGATVAAAPSGDALTVLAASSLTEAFGQIGEDFEAAHPGVVVNFSFGASDGLAQQIEQGSPTDVFASASTEWMDAVAGGNPGVSGRADFAGNRLVGNPGVSGRADFAGNRLVVIVPNDNPAQVHTFDDLSGEGVKLVIAAAGVPVGDYAREALGNAGIGAQAEANVVSNEEDAKAVLQKVLLGEADAGIVYVTDVTPALASQVKTVAIADDVNVIATYPIAVVNGGPNTELGQEFVERVLSPEGRSVLESHGFLPAS